MADTATETEMTDMVADHAKKIHARDSTKAMGTKRIHVSYAGTRVNSTSIGLSFGGFQSFFPSSPGVSRYRSYTSAISTKVLLPPPHTCTQFDLIVFLQQKAFHLW
jgi:hypothetical protein